MPSTIISIDYTSSTNDYARSLLKKDNPAPFTVIFAYEQTRGKGQKNNSWHSAPGKNLTCSIIVYPYFLRPDQQFAINETVCLAIADVLNPIFKGFMIKWPNDIYYHRKKIGGILVENSLMGNSIEYVIIGIGLNINQTSFPGHLPNPVSLTQITGKKYNLNSILDSLLFCFEKRFHQLKKRDFEGLRKAYHQNLYLRYQYHCFRSEKGTFKGRILGVDLWGRLIIEAEDGQEYSFSFKEIAF